MTLIKITELSPVCLTRPRGDEAFDKLRPYLEMSGATVDLDLDAAEAPSSSFLDQLILRLLSSNQLDAVTFVTRTDRVRKRLAAIAGARRLTLYFKPGLQAIRRPVPMTSPGYEAEYDREKPA